VTVSCPRAVLSKARSEMIRNIARGVVFVLCKWAKRCWRGQIS
jgi:hypothetical protein